MARFFKIEDDEIFACQVLKCFEGFKDEDKFVNYIIIQSFFQNLMASYLWLYT